MKSGFYYTKMKQKHILFPMARDGGLWFGREMYLQATASAADPSSTRRNDGWMDRWMFCIGIETHMIERWLVVKNWIPHVWCPVVSCFVFLEILDFKNDEIWKRICCKDVSIIVLFFFLKHSYTQKDVERLRFGESFGSSRNYTKRIGIQQESLISHLGIR